MKTPNPIIQVNNQELVCPPAYLGDAGHDIFAMSDPRIEGVQVAENFFSSISYIEYDTDLIIAPDAKYHTYVFPRSSISKTNLILANSVAVIDNGYRGTIKLRFKYVMQPNDMYLKNDQFACEVDLSKIYKLGERIGQLVFVETTNARLIESSSLPRRTDRKDGGFGSSGS